MLFTTQTLEHDNIVRFIDYLDRQTPQWAFGSMCFIIMERCPGGSLRDWIRKMKSTLRRTSIDEATVIASQLVSALSYCHKKNKVHLDIKPANVFMLDDGITVCFASQILINLIKKILLNLVQIGRLW